MLYYLYQPLLLAHRHDWRALHPLSDAGDEGVGGIHDVVAAAIVFRHFNETAVGHPAQLKQILRVGAAKLKDVLVVVAHGYHPHFLVCTHKGGDKGKIVGTHVLCLVNHQHGLANLAGFHLAGMNHLCGLSHHQVCVFKIARSAQEVEAIGMEGLDFHIMGGIAYQFHQPLLELGGCGTREGEHQ